MPVDNITMEFVVYIYAGKHATLQMRPFRCCRCGRIVFQHNSKRLEITNAFGVSLQQIQSGTKDVNGLPAATEHKCHSCKSLFKILYQ